MEDDRTKRAVRVRIDLPSLSGAEAYRALAAASSALDDAAREHTFSIDAEWTRHTCRTIVGEMDGNHGGIIHAKRGPNEEYFWLAKWTREPTPYGLADGRLERFEIYRYHRAEYTNDNIFPPNRSVEIARLLNGVVTRIHEDPELDWLIDEIKQPPAWEKLKPIRPKSRDDLIPGNRGIHDTLKSVVLALDELAAEGPLSFSAARARTLCEETAAKIERSHASFMKALRRARTFSPEHEDGLEIDYDLRDHGLDRD